MPHRVSLTTLLLAMTWAHANAHAQPAGPAATTAAKGTMIVQGHQVSWNVAMNRASYVALRRRGDALVAILGSGHLARLDPETLLPVVERVGPEYITALGDGPNGQLLAGTDDGAIVDVDPHTLALLYIHQGPSCEGTQASWVGARAGHTLALCEQSVADESCSQAQSMFVRRPQTALIDSHDRLWVGASMGEFGGWMGRYDLDGCRYSDVSSSKESEQRVTGLLEHGGQIYAYGGVSHLGSATSSVARVDGDRLRVLMYYDGLPSIDSMLAVDDGFVFASEGGLYHVAPSFDGLRKLAAIPGSPTGLVALDDGSFIVVTGRMGVYRVMPDGKVRHVALPDEVDYRKTDGAWSALAHRRGHPPTHLDHRDLVEAVDGLGRKWSAGDLTLGVAPGNSLSFREVPGVGRRVIYAIAPDPDAPDGVIVTVNEAIVKVRVTP